ncbi:Transforming protein RhoA, partial [Plecturocebus cupreus]
MAAIRKKREMVGDGARGKTRWRVVSGGVRALRVENHVADVAVDGKQSWLCGTQLHRKTPVLSRCVFPSTVLIVEKTPRRVAPGSQASLSGVPIALVGNKKGIRNDEHTRRELAKVKQAPVKPEEARDVTHRIGAFGYMECSAKTEDGASEAPEPATRAALQAR